MWRPARFDCRPPSRLFNAANPHSASPRRATHDIPLSPHYSIPTRRIPAPSEPTPVTHAHHTTSASLIALHRAIRVPTTAVSFRSVASSGALPPHGPERPGPICLIIKDQALVAVQGQRLVPHTRLPIRAIRRNLPQVGRPLPVGQRIDNNRARGTNFAPPPLAPDSPGSSFGLMIGLNPLVRSWISTSF